jgi:hypothetical protein
MPTAEKATDRVVQMQVYIAPRLRACAVRALFPDGDVVLQRHRLTWARDADAPYLTMYGVLVKRQVGPFLLLREYLAPIPDHSAGEHAIGASESTAVFDKEP